MKTPLPTYRPFGNPDSGIITVNQVIAGDKVTISGTDFVAGTDFSIGSGDSIAIAEYLAACINGGTSPDQRHVNSIVRPYWAYFISNFVIVIAVTPGSSGITLAKTGAGFSVSGATLSGGTSGGTTGSGIPTTDGGAGWTQLRGINADKEPFDGDASGAGAIVATGQGDNIIIIDDLFVTVRAACELTFIEDTVSKLIHKMTFTSAGSQQFTPRGKLELPPAASLNCASTTADTITVMALYHEEAP